MFLMYIVKLNKSKIEIRYENKKESEAPLISLFLMLIIISISVFEGFLDFTKILIEEFIKSCETVPIVCNIYTYIHSKLEKLDKIFVENKKYIYSIIKKKTINLIVKKFVGSVEKKNEDLNDVFSKISKSEFTNYNIFDNKVNLNQSLDESKDIDTISKMKSLLQNNKEQKDQTKGLIDLMDNKPKMEILLDTNSENENDLNIGSDKNKQINFNKPISRKGRQIIANNR